MRKTKIIATLGPASSKYEIIEELIRNGVDVFRLNFAHGTLEQKKELIKMIRKAEEDLDTYVSIMADIPGRGPRIGTVPKRYLNRNEKVVMVFGEKQSDNPHIIPVPDTSLLEIINTGDEILLADGRIIVRVDRILENELEGTIISDGEIRANVSITIRNRPLLSPALTERDKEFVKFAVKNDVDYIALSFVQSRKDIKDLKNYMRSLNSYDIKVISKIENKPAIMNLNAIINESDAVLIARGDLGVQLSLEEIPYLENLIINRSLRNGKPVILATQVLESMIESPVPTRAEIMDIATAVEKGVDAIMLSGETAIGKHPIQAVSWLRRVIEKTESYTSFPRTEIPKDSPIYVKFNRSIVSMAEYLDAKIVAYTTRGFTAMIVSSFRPRQDIIAISNNKKTVRQLKLLWGVYPMYIDRDKVGLQDLGDSVISNKIAKPGNRLVITLGWRSELGRVQEVRIEEVR